MTTPEFTVEAWRQILRNGKLCIGIERVGRTEPVYADDITQRIAALLNATLELPLIEVRGLAEQGGVKSVLNRLCTDNERLREALRFLVETAEYLVRADYADTPLEVSVRKARAALSATERK